MARFPCNLLRESDLRPPPVAIGRWRNMARLARGYRDGGGRAPYWQKALTARYRFFVEKTPCGFRGENYPVFSWYFCACGGSQQTKCGMFSAKFWGGMYIPTLYEPGPGRANFRA